MADDRSAPHDRDALARRRAAAEAIGAAAARTALGYFEARDRLTIERKSSAQDLVSEADQTVEHEIRAAVRAAFPEDGLLGEEHGHEPGTSPYTWVIDPIDGTSPFLNGLPTWCVSIAVAAGETPVVGVIVAPALGETYVAEAGAGATLNGRPLRIDPATDLDSGNLGVGSPTPVAANAASHAAFLRGLMDRGGVYYRHGSGAVMLAYVASGRLAGYYDPTINAWDCFAGNLLVIEAGGLARYDGRALPPTRGPLRAGSARAVEAIEGIMADVAGR